MNKIDFDIEKQEFNDYYGIPPGEQWSTHHITDFVIWLAAIRSVVQREQFAAQKNLSTAATTTPAQMSTDNE